MEIQEFDARTEAARAVRAQLEKMGLSQAELERQLGVKRSVVSRALGGSPLDQRSTTWAAMLDALGLEVIIRAKSTAADQQRAS